MTASDDVADRVQVALAANGPDLLAYLERRVAVREDAADLLGETMLTAWRRAASLPVDAERPRMWLFVTARNVLANHGRASRRSDELAKRLRETLSVSAPRVASDGRDTGSEVRDAVDRLPGRQRELVRLVHWDGFSIVEAAEILGIGASTARSRYATARAALRAALGPADPPPDTIGARTSWATATE